MPPSKPTWQPIEFRNLMICIFIYLRNPLSQRWHHLGDILVYSKVWELKYIFISVQLWIDGATNASTDDTLFRSQNQCEKSTSNWPKFGTTLTRWTRGSPISGTGLEWLPNIEYSGKQLVLIPVRIHQLLFVASSRFYTNSDQESTSLEIAIHMQTQCIYRHNKWWSSSVE